MKKFIMAVFLVFMLFGCADDKNQSLQNPSDNNSTEDNNTSNQDEYFKAIINTLSNIPVSDNVSQWGFEPYDATETLHVFLADKLGRPNKNTNKIVYIDININYYYSNNKYFFKIYEKKYESTTLLHRMEFDLSDKYNLIDMEHAVIGYYAKFIKTEPYKTIYNEIIYIKKN